MTIESRLGAKKTKSNYSIELDENTNILFIYK